MENTSNPSALLLTRQKLPKLDLKKSYIEQGVKKGAYIVHKEAIPDAVLYATGSEVHLAIEVCKEINYKVQIINVPCWELLETQTKSYIDSIMMKKCNKRISLEAGITAGWEKFTGLNGLNIGIDNYGASAPGKDVANHFEFVKNKIKSKIEGYLDD
jgi:transketolase